MKKLSYYNLTTDDWHGTRISFTGDREACIRLQKKIMKLVANDADENISDYTFIISDSVNLNFTDTIFVIDTILPDDVMKRFSKRNIKMIFLDYIRATGHTATQLTLKETDWAFLKVIEKYINIPSTDIEAHELLTYRAYLRSQVEEDL